MVGAPGVEQSSPDNGLAGRCGQNAGLEPKTEFSTPPAPRLGYVYFIADDDAIKIGYSLCPEGRLADIQANTSRPLRLLAKVCGSMDDERRLHDHFAEYRIKGEWFRLNDRLKDMLRQIDEYGLLYASSNPGTVQDLIAGKFKHPRPDENLPTKTRDAMRAFVEQRDRDGWESPEVEQWAKFSLYSLEQAAKKKLPTAMRDALATYTDNLEKALLAAALPVSARRKANGLMLLRWRQSGEFERKHRSATGGKG